MKNSIEKIKCAVYARVSTDNQAEVEFNSCEAQEARIRSFIKSQENMEVFEDSNLGPVARYCSS